MSSADSQAAAHAEANRQTLAGINLLAAGAPAAALACFETAIALRSPLPLAGQPEYRWGLTAGWLNRAEALTRLGGEDRLREAVRSCDLAIAHLHRLPLEAEPRYRWRLALAWVHRGLAWQQLGGGVNLDQACSSFTTALQTLAAGGEPAPPAWQQVRGAAWMNRANARLGHVPPRLHDALDDARAAVRQARALAADLHGRGEIVLKALHVLGRCLAGLLETPPVDPALADDWILEAGDAAEAALAEAGARPEHRELADELFHFGCRIYRAFQPHFLADYLGDALAAGDASPARQAAVREVLAQATAQLQHEGLSALTSGRLHRLARILAGLQAARTAWQQTGGSH